MLYTFESDNKAVKFREFAVRNVLDLEFSVNDSFLSVFSRYVKTDNADVSPHKNVTVWDVKRGEEVFCYTHKNPSSWSMKWTEDEAYCARLMPSEVQFYDAQNFANGVWGRLKQEGIASFSLSPGKQPVIAAFSPERKGQPASVKLMDITNLDTILSQKAFYRADSVQFHWNRIGTNVLIFTHTDVDATGQSYYGETNLYYLSINGNFDCRVELGIQLLLIVPMDEY